MPYRDGGDVWRWRGCRRVGLPRRWQAGNTSRYPTIQHTREPKNNEPAKDEYLPAMLLEGFREVFSNKSGKTALAFEVLVRGIPTFATGLALLTM